MNVVTPSLISVCAELSSRTRFYGMYHGLNLRMRGAVRGGGHGLGVGDALISVCAELSRSGCHVREDATLNLRMRGAV